MRVIIGLLVLIVSVLYLPRIQQISFYTATLLINSSVQPIDLAEEFRAPLYENIASTSGGLFVVATNTTNTVPPSANLLQTLDNNSDVAYRNNDIAGGNILTILRASSIQS